MKAGLPYYVPAWFLQSSGIEMPRYNPTTQAFIDGLEAIMRDPKETAARKLEATAFWFRLTYRDKPATKKSRGRPLKKSAETVEDLLRLK